MAAGGFESKLQTGRNNKATNAISFPYSVCGFVVDFHVIRIVRTRTVSPFRTDNPNDTIFYAADAKTLAALGQRRGGVYPHPRCCGAFAFYLVRCW